MINIISELRSTEEGRLLHDFMRERFPKRMDTIDQLVVFANCDNLGWIKKEQDEFYADFETWKTIKSLTKKKIK